MSKDENKETKGGAGGKLTKSNLRSRIDGEIKQARVKELQGKLKELVKSLGEAKKVIAGKEQQIEDLLEEYIDVLD